jgi:hypothetical protein
VRRRRVLVLGCVYLLCSVGVGILWFVSRANALGSWRASDALMEVAVAACILLVPMLFVLVGCYLQWLWTRKAGNDQTRWAGLLVYSLVVLALWCGLRVGRVVTLFGSSVHWIGFVGTLLSYGSYLMVAIAMLTSMVALVALVAVAMTRRARDGSRRAP